MPQTFLQCDQPTHSAVAILKGMNALKLSVESNDMLVLRNQEVPPNSPKELVKAAQEFSQLRIGVFGFQGGQTGEKCRHSAALRFYMGYLGSFDATEYLSKTLVTVIQGTLDDHNNRLRSLLFKWCVELNMMCHTIATHFRADPIDRRELRTYAIDEAKRTNGQISFGNALDAQQVNGHGL